MYGQFLYFIAVIFICSTYVPPPDPVFDFPQAIFLFLLQSAFLAGHSWLKFRKIERNMGYKPLTLLDREYNDAMTWQTVYAIVFLVIALYGIHFPDFLIQWPLFSTFPTLFAGALITIFLGYMTIVWKMSHGLYQKIYRNPISPREYIVSNLSFPAPVILPWLVLSLIADLFGRVPLGPLSRFFSSTMGEVLYFLFFLLVIAAVGPFFIQKLWRCKPLDDGDIRDRIRGLCLRAGLEVRDILYWPAFGGKMITAGVMGMMGRFRYLLITPSLTRLLSFHEMDAVIAHEIGHIKKKHLVYYLVLLLGFFIMAYAMIHIVLHVLTGFPGLIGMLLNAGADPGVIFSGAFNFLFAGGFLLYFRYGFGFFMRNFERQADTYVYRLFESAGPLITTLEKIAFSSGLSPEKPNWHHFSIRERINFLMKCESDRSWIRRHETKIGRALIGYLVALAVAGTFEASLLPRQIENNFQRTLFETAIFMEIGKSPQDPALYRLLGDLYQETGNFDKAVSAYQESLSLDPENPETLNNLAWLWAACPDEAYRDPRKALLTARKAALLNPSPYILDTLAESYFVNGEYEEAIRAGKKALETAGDNPAYYENQLKKFRKAASAHGSPL